MDDLFGGYGFVGVGCFFVFFFLSSFRKAPVQGHAFYFLLDNFSFYVMFLLLNLVAPKVGATKSLQGA